jgi:hypothetical protein
VSWNHGWAENSGIIEFGAIIVTNMVQNAMKPALGNKSLCQREFKLAGTYTVISISMHGLTTPASSDVSGSVLVTNKSKTQRHLQWLSNSTTVKVGEGHGWRMDQSSSISP